MQIQRRSESAGSRQERRGGYYGRSVIKPPSWTMLIPAYIFVGGFCGASSLLAFAARLRRKDALAVPLVYGAGAGTLISMYCLIKDLGRPERFINMLRVFKPTSPMNRGTYIFCVYGSAAISAAGCQATGILRPLGRASEGVAACFGPAMTVYTGVLLADTAVPTWNEGRRSLPLVFAASSATAAGAWGMLSARPPEARMARRFALLGGIGTLVASRRLKHEIGPVLAETFSVGDAKAYRQWAARMTFGGILFALLAKSRRQFSMLGGVLLFGGAFLEKWAAYRAGYISAQDPKYAIALQRQRVDANGTPTRLREARTDL